MLNSNLAKNLRHGQDTSLIEANNPDNVVDEDLIKELPDLLMPKNFLTRNEFIEVVREINSNKIYSIQFRLINQIVNILTINGRKINKVYTPSQFIPENRSQELLL